MANTSKVKMNFTWLDRLIVPNSDAETDYEFFRTSECGKTIPAKPGWWDEVRYASKLDVFGEEYTQYIDSDDRGNLPMDIPVDVNSDNIISLEIFEHKLDETTKGSQLWTAFDIPHNPLWKYIVGNYTNGLTKKNVMIIRMLNQDPKHPGYNIAMYINSNTYSSYFTMTKLEAGTVDKIDYREEYCMSSTDDLAGMYNAMKYAYELNGNRPFNIIEQLRDYRHNGETLEIMSNLEPKTEIRQEWNLFEREDGVPKFVFTNWRPQIFTCRKGRTEDNSEIPNHFVVSRR